MEKKADIFKLMYDYIGTRRYCTEEKYSLIPPFISKVRQQIENIMADKAFDPNQMSKDRIPLICEAAKDERLIWVVKTLIANPKTDLSVRDVNGMSPYAIANVYGNYMASDLLAKLRDWGAGEPSSDYATFFQCQNFEGKDFFYAYCFNFVRSDERIEVIKAKLVHKGHPIYNQMYMGYIKNGYRFKNDPYAAIVNVKENRWMGWLMEPTSQIDAEGDRVITNPYIFAYHEYCKAKMAIFDYEEKIRNAYQKINQIQNVYLNPNEHMSCKDWDVE